MKRLIGYTAAICLLAITVGCGGVTSSGTLAYVSNSLGTGFTVFTINTDGTLTKSSISPQNTPAAPKVLQFTANGKWAYFLDEGGANIYAYTRAGNGELTTKIDSYPTGPNASSLVISPSSSFIYVAQPSTKKLAVYSIDNTTGILSQVGSSYQIGYAITQLVMVPGGNVLFGLSPSQQSVLTLTLNTSSGVPTIAGSLPVGVNPTYMVLAANGSYLYVLDHTATTPAGAAQCNAAIFGYNVQGSSIPLAMAGSPFSQNPDAITGVCPTNPVAGVTTNDSKYLFVANQGSHNISAFKISSTTGIAGEPSEVLGSITTVNGIKTSDASPFDCGFGAGTCITPAFTAVSGSNNALYVMDTNASKIFQYRIDQNTGKLRPQNPASVSAETATSAPTWITIR